MEEDIIKLNRSFCVSLVFVLRELAEQEHNSSLIHSNPSFIIKHQYRAEHLYRIADEVDKQLSKTP